MNEIYKTISDIVAYIKDKLLNSYPEHEIENLIYLIFEHLLNYTKIDIYIHRDKTISNSIQNQIFEITSDLKKNKPIQYIIGKTEFFGLTFKISSDVMIPRQETEELVTWIIKENIKRNTKILDIGTGCGCIAIALKKFLNGSTVEALDISKKAVKLAERNAQLNKVSVRFFNYNILKFEKKQMQMKYDIIVSNPPYIRESEKSILQANVLDYEPQEALFVPDNDPLKFYIAIAKFGLHSLSERGMIYFEINEFLANQVKTELIQYGYKRVEVRKDINNKDRMVKAYKN
jgi:release factor glutamine methyltransferase